MEIDTKAIGLVVGSIITSLILAYVKLRNKVKLAKALLKVVEDVLAVEDVLDETGDGVIKPQFETMLKYAIKKAKKKLDKEESL